MGWTLDCLPWDQFNPDLVDLNMVPMIKAASLVEYHVPDYGIYLKRVFKEVPLILDQVDSWVEDEVRDGVALGLWVKKVDQSYDLDGSVERFRSLFRVPLEADESIRGSQTGELVARCIVETGTSSFYSALAHHTQEPLLKAICLAIARDEFCHYKLFYTHLKRLLERNSLSKWHRLWIALQRIQESESDELATAYYAANVSPDLPYDHTLYSRLYLAPTYALYRLIHIQKAAQMVAKVAGLSGQSRWTAWAGYLIFQTLQLKRKMTKADIKQSKTNSHPIDNDGP